MRAKLVELPLIPGALSDDTDLAAKLHANDMDKVRFRGNRAETIKGWTAFNASGVGTGTARGVHTYADLTGNPIVVAASESKVYAWMDGTRNDITPKWCDVWLGSTSHGGAQSATYNGSTGSVLITWNVYIPSAGTSTETAHNLVTGDTVTFSNTVNRGTSGINIEGSFAIATVPSETTFTVSAGGTATSIILETPFVVTVPFKTGVVTGTGSTSAAMPRVYSIDNFGENAVFCGSDGTPIFMWAPETNNSELVTNGTFASTSSWTVGSFWTITGGVAQLNDTGTVDTLYQNVSGILNGGGVYEMSFGITAWSGATDVFRVMIDSVDIFPPITTQVNSSADSNMDRTYTFRFVAPSNPSQLKFLAQVTDATNTKIDNVSIKRMITAVPLNNAPQKNYALFVDGNHICNALGSVEADGDFNANLLRWCDQDNINEWVPDTTNVAGEFILGKGNKAVCGAQVGERNLILTDDAAYTATFTSNGYSIRQIGQGCGAVGQRSLAVYNNRAFWPSKSGFYAYDGAQVLAVECPIKDRYVGKLAQYQENKTYAFINVEYGEVWFVFPHTSDGTEISRYNAFNFLEEHNPWSFGTWNRTCMTRAGTFQNPIGIDTSGNIWNHETGTGFSGGGITLPFLETGYVTGEAGDRWLGCRRYYPDFENQTGDILFTVTGKRAPQGSSLTQVIGPKTLTTTTTKTDFLLRSRQLKFKWASSSSTTQWRLGIVGLEMLAQKERR